MVTDRDYELLSDYLDDALNASERTALEARLTADAELRRELDALRATVALVKSLPVRQAPRNFTLDASMVRRPTSQRLWFSPVFYSAVSTIAAVFLLGFGLLLLTQNQSAAPIAVFEQQAAGIALRPSPTALLKDTDDGIIGSDGSTIGDASTNLPIAPPQPLDSVEETQRDQTTTTDGEASVNNDALQTNQLGQQAQSEIQPNNSPQPDGTFFAAPAQAYSPSAADTSIQPPPALSNAAPSSGTVDGYGTNSQTAGQEFGTQADQGAAIAAAPITVSTPTQIVTEPPTATLTQTPVPPTETSIPPTPTLQDTPVPAVVAQAPSSANIALLSIVLGIALLVAAVFFYLRSRRRL